ncbi:uncharacterized protein DS421_1g18720 [Arachis hypogaea]|nr:uncharacterized protein DS421_1g18720 [Arachis hypogaea]
MVTVLGGWPKGVYGHDFGGWSKRVYGHGFEGDINGSMVTIFYSDQKGAMVTVFQKMGELEGEEEGKEREKGVPASHQARRRRAVAASSWAVARCRCWVLRQRYCRQEVKERKLAQEKRRRAAISRRHCHALLSQLWRPPPLLESRTEEKGRATLREIDGSQ